MKLSLLALLLVGTSARADIIADIEGFTPAEKNVITFALGQWESIIDNRVSLDVLIRKDQLPNGVAASTDEIQMDAGGFPQHARITINDEPSPFFPWFVDPTPSANEEFAPGRTEDSWVALPGSAAAGGYDLLTVAEHELTHALGFSILFPLFAAHVQIGQDSLRYYEGNGISVPLTPAFLGTHIEESLFGPDLMNSVLQPGQRFAPSYYDLAILDDAFGYGIPLGPPPVTAPEPGTLACLSSIIVLLAAVFRAKQRARL